MFKKKIRAENSYKKEKPVVQNNMNQKIEEKMNELQGEELTEFLLDTIPIVYNKSLSYREKHHEMKKIFPEDLLTKKDIQEQCKPEIINEQENEQVYVPDGNTIVQKKFNYQKILHFKSKLMSLQAKEQKIIPQDLIDKIHNELKKYRLTFADLDFKLTKKILKDIDASEYYSNIYTIINITNNKKQIVIPQDIEEKLYQMFELIQEPYKKYKGKKSSFLNYYYTLYKFFEILNFDEYLYIFPNPILKNRNKIYEHDTIWKKICEEVNFPFYPTI